jgi:Xaa-Pro aminopeptidase
MLPFADGTTPRERIRLLQERIKEQGWGGALLFYSRDVYYFSGTARPAYLFVTPDDFLLFIRSGFEFALQDVFLGKERVFEERSLSSIFKKVAPLLSKKEIATELDILTVTQYLQFREVFNGFEFVNVSPAVLAQRMRKDPLEIEKIRTACDILDAGHKAAVATIKEGVTELEVAAAIESAHRTAGHEGVIFMRQPDFFMSRGPLASGPNLSKFSGVVFSITGVGLSTSVPVGPSRRRLEQGDLIIVDIPTHVQGYHADQTRTYCLGSAGDQVGEMYAGMKEIADHLIAVTRPGVTCSEIYETAEKKARELHLEDGLLSFGSGTKSHMIGHGIGLECSEPPVISKYEYTPVGENFVITIEMHLFRPGVGVVKLEDVVHIGTEKNEILTRSPRNLIEV